MPPAWNSGPANEERPLAEAVDQDARHRCDEEQRGLRTAAGCSSASSGPEPNATGRTWRDEEHRRRTARRRRRTMAALLAEKARERKKRMGSIGSRARSCQASEGGDQRLARRASAHQHLGAAPSRAGLPRTSPHTTPSMPPVTSARPRQVERGVGAAALGDPGQRAAGSARPTIGTVSEKIHSHAMLLVTAPPTSGPLGHGQPVDGEEQRRAPSPAARAGRRWR